MHEDFTLPALFHRAKTGKISLWAIRATDIDGIPNIVTRYGYIDGQKQETAVAVPQGKNLGRSNETTAWEQACAEAESKWNKQKLGNYRESLDDETMLLPMLAHKYKDHSHRLSFPCYSQPKLNGSRVLAKVTELGIEYYSRKGKQYKTLQHWDWDISTHFPLGTVLDGEAFNPELTFQEIIRRLKRDKTNRDNLGSHSLQFWIYDVVQPTVEFKDRYEFLIKNLPQNTQNLVLCPTLLVHNVNEIKSLHSNNTLEGYEGTMLRNAAGLYMTDYRSYDLLKYKDFLDAEYKIVGGCSAKGKDAGTVVFECVTPSGQVFSVRPKGTFARRKAYLDNLDTLIGEMLTVQYQETSEDGVPIFPVGLEIRDYE